MVDFISTLFIVATTTLGFVTADKTGAVHELNQDFVCPKPTGQFPDPTDCNAYYK